MKGKDFVNSKWCRDAASPEVQSHLKQNFGKWSSRVRNAGILNRAKQLYQFFLSSEITGIQKVIVAGALLYVLSPLDLIPDFIPVIGWLDDLGIASFALSYIFSQMDSLEQKKAAGQADVPVEQNVSAEELLERDIAGTGNTAFEISDHRSDFSLSVETSRGTLQEKLADLAALAEEIQASDRETVLKNIEERIAACRIQKVAVVGRYSTGKSTLINALLNKEILPSSPVPTTKAVTFLIHGEEPALYSEEKNGEIIVHESLANLLDLYNAEIRRAEKITVVLPDFPFPGLTIADTPGLEDPDQSVIQLTLDILPETDAIVVLLDANYLESKVELEFIASLLQYDRNRKLFIVINKADGKSPEERRKLEQLCKSHLIASQIPATRIFTISARSGVDDDGFVEFRKELFNFLQNGIQQEAIRHAESEMQTYARSLLNACDAAVAAAAEDQKQFRADQKIAREKIEKISEEYDSQKIKICRKFAMYRSQFFLEFADFIERLKAAIRQEILQAKLETLRNTDNIAVKIKQEIVAFVDGKITEMDETLQADMAESHAQIREALSKLELPIEVKVKDYSAYAGLFIPAVVAGSYFFVGFFSFVWIVIAAVIGRNFFEGAISQFLSTVGINRIREKVAEAVCSKLDQGKKELDAKLNTSFDLMEQELVNSFNSAKGSAVAPLRIVYSDTLRSPAEIMQCREKLVAFCDENN